MMFKSHYGETITVVLAIVMGLIMAFAVIVVDHLKLNFSNVFSIWAMVTLVILLVSIVIPYKAWSARVTALLRLHEGSISYRLVDNILPSLILNTFNTAIVSATSIFFNEAIPASEQAGVWFQGMIHDWPITFVISYFAAFAAEAAGKMVAGNYCSSQEKCKHVAEAT